MSMFSGRIQLKTMDMINTTATTFCAKTDCMIDGKIFQIPLSLAANLGYRFYAHHLHTHYTCDWPQVADQGEPLCA